MDRNKLVLIFILIFHLVNNLYVLTADNVPLVWDQKDYYLEGLDFYTSPRIDFLFHTLNKQYPPMFAILMYPMLIFGQSQDNACFLNTVLFLISIYLVYELGKTIFKGNVGLLSAVLFSMYPRLIGLSRTCCLDILMMTITLICTYLFIILKFGRFNKGIVKRNSNRLPLFDSIFPNGLKNITFSEIINLFGNLGDKKMLFLSILLGICLAIGLLTKISFIPIVCILLFLLFFYFLKHKNLSYFFVIGAVILILAFPFYLLNLKDMMQNYVPYRLKEANLFEGWQEKSISLKEALNILDLVIFTLFFIYSIFLLISRFEKYIDLFIIFSGYLSFLAIINYPISVYYLLSFLPIVFITLSKFMNDIIKMTTFKIFMIGTFFGILILLIQTQSYDTFSHTRRFHTEGIIAPFENYVVIDILRYIPSNSSALVIGSSVTLESFCLYLNCRCIQRFGNHPDCEKETLGKSDYVIVGYPNAYKNLEKRNPQLFNEFNKTRYSQSYIRLQEEEEPYALIFRKI